MRITWSGVAGWKTRRTTIGSVAVVIGTLTAGASGAVALPVEPSQISPLVALEPGQISAEGTPITAEQAAHTVLTRSEAAASLNPAAVAYYTRTYGVDEAEARQRLENQVMVPNLQGMLKGQLGSSFSQLWFDNAAGQWVLDTTSPTASNAVGSLMSSVASGVSYRIQHVAFNREQLIAAVKQLAEELPATIPSGQFTVGVGEGAVDLTLASGQPSGAADTAITKLAAEGNPVPVRMTRSPESSLSATPAVSCSQFPWCNDIVGGVDVFFKSGYECSAGYYVRSSGDPYPLVLTAGHCDIVAGNYGEWGTCNGTGGCGWYGHQIPFYYYGNGGGDAGLIEDDSYGIYPGYVNWTYYHSVSTLKSYETEPAPDGTVVCMQGAHAPGTSCGTITDNNDWGVEYAADPPLLPKETLNGMIQVTGACILRGDSGGPADLASVEEAAGLNSAGHYSESECTAENKSNYLEPINRAIAQLGVSFET